MAGDYHTLCAKIDKLSARSSQRDTVMERVDTALFGEDHTGGLVDEVRTMKVYMKLMLWAAGVLGSCTIGLLFKIAFGG